MERFEEGLITGGCRGVQRRPEAWIKFEDVNPQLAGLKFPNSLSDTFIFANSHNSHHSLLHRRSTGTAYPGWINNQVGFLITMDVQRSRHQVTGLRGICALTAFHCLFYFFLFFFSALGH
jgi:hypothetical protein